MKQQRKKFNILFRTYGGKTKNKQTGIGHVIRCINLAQKLKHDANIFFLVEDFGGAKEVIDNYHFKFSSKIKKEIGYKEEINLLTKFIQSNNIDFVVVDQHKISDQIIKKLNNYTKTLVISDLEKLNFSSDIIVNGFVGLKNQKKYTNHQLQLLGPKYQILNTNFSKLHKSKKIFDLLITIGGLDECNISEFILNSLNDKLEYLKIKIILGPLVKKTIFIKNLEKKFPKNLIVIHSTNNMAKEISQTKFGITSGGITSYEFASQNIPFAIICDDIHQIPTAEKWSKLKKAVFLGYFNNSNKLHIQKLLVNLTERKISFKKSNTKLIDGLGSSKVCFEILNMLQNSK